MSAQIPFHYGLFFNAMIGYIGREPDDAVRLGWDGIYSFTYRPRDDEEEKKFPEYAATLAEWLDLFEITFSGSRCQYGPASMPDETKQDVLEIRISHPKKPPEAK